jgi:microcystin-dependent protein
VAAAGSLPDVARRARAAQVQSFHALHQPPIGTITGWGGASDPPGDAWMICDGRVLSQEKYKDLYAVLGTVWNTGGEAETSFRLPDLRSRAPVGAGQGSGLSNRTLASRFGAETHQLTVAQLAEHGHFDWTGSVSWSHHHGDGTTGEAFWSHDHGDGTTGERTVGHQHQMHFENFEMSGSFAAGRKVLSSQDWPDSTYNPFTDGTSTDTTHDHAIATENWTHNHSIPSDGSSQPYNNMSPSLAVNFIIRVGT